MSASPITIAQPLVVQPPRPGRWHYLALLGIVLFGLTLRFAMLDRPALWGDEAATWARTSGTFREMLEGNRSDGFVPLHYEIYWAMGKLWTLTPWRMRLVPALAGALMVPAMYFLARQLLSLRASLLVSLLTACSAFLLNYSRDAKMYMQTWLFVALHVGFLLWWLRGAGGVAWWSWLACGVAAVGMHASAWLVLPAEIVVFATYGRPRVGRSLLFLLAIVAMAAGPWYYYRSYNTWAEKSGRNWHQSGIGWIESQTRNKTGPELVRDSASAYLVGYSRAEEEVDRDGNIPISPRILNLAWAVLAGIVIVGVVALPRWPTRQPANSQRAWAPWQLLLWLGVWLTIPTYFFYCRSVQEPSSPVNWLQGAVHYFSWQLLWMACLCLGLILLSRRNISRWTTVAVLGALLATCLLYAVWQGGAMWYAVLMQLAYRPWLVGGLVAIGAAVSWVHCGDRFAARAWRASGGILVAIFILGACQATWHVLDYMHKSSPPAQWQSIWMPRYLAVIVSAVILALAVLICRLPGWPLRLIAVLGIIGANLAQFTAHIALDPEPRIDLIAADVVKAERDPSILVYVAERFAMGAPGASTIGDITGRYYVALELGQKFSAYTCRYGPTDQMVRQLRRLTSLRWVANDLRQKPGITTLVLWQRLRQQRDGDDSLDPDLGPDWQKVSETAQIARRHWNWQYMDELRRIEYRRRPEAPAAAPSVTQPASPR